MGIDFGFVTFSNKKVINFSEDYQGNLRIIFVYRLGFLGHFWWLLEVTCIFTKQIKDIYNECLSLCPPIQILFNQGSMLVIPMSILGVLSVSLSV